MSRILGVIPARYASTRFPGKPLALLCGRPLLHWVIERARQASALDGVLVATDDPRIRACALETGVDTVMTAPDHPSGTDRIAEAVRHTEATAVINIQGDEPLIDPALIDILAANLAGDAPWDMVTAATPVTTREEAASPDVVKVVMTEEGRALYFSRSPIPCPRDVPADAHGDGLFHRHIGLYGYRRAFLDAFVRTPPSRLELIEKLEQLRALEMGARIRILITGQAGPGVDRPEDLARVETLLAGERP